MIVCFRRRRGRRHCHCHSDASSSSLSSSSPSSSRILSHPVMSCHVNVTLHYLMSYSSHTMPFDTVDCFASNFLMLASQDLQREHHIDMLLDGCRYACHIEDPNTSGATNSPLQWGSKRRIVASRCIPCGLFGFIWGPSDLGSVISSAW